MGSRLKALAALAAETLAGRLVRKFGQDQAANGAVLIAWNLLFALFPIVLVAAGVLGLVLGHVGLNSRLVYDDMLAVIPDQAGRDQALSGLAAVRNQTGIFFLVGLAGFAWSGTSLFTAMEQAFDVVFHAPQRGFVQQKVMAMLMMLLFTVLAGLAVGTSALLPLLGTLPNVPVSLIRGPAAFVIQAVLGAVSGVILFGAIYYVVPNRPQHLAKIWPGALLGGLLFEALTLLFPLYIQVNRGINQYGKTFAFLFVLLTFFYFLGLICMIGVELNSLVYPVPVKQASDAPGSQPRAVKPAEHTSVAARAKRGLFSVGGLAVGLLAGRRRRLS